MEKHTYEPPRMQLIIALQREVVCASAADANFSNEGYGAEEEQFVW